MLVGGDEFLLDALKAGAEGFSLFIFFLLQFIQFII